MNTSSDIATAYIRPGIPVETERMLNFYTFLDIGSITKIYQESYGIYVDAVTNELIGRDRRMYRHIELFGIGSSAAGCVADPNPNDRVLILVPRSSLISIRRGGTAPGATHYGETNAKALSISSLIGLGGAIQLGRNGTVSMRSGGSSFAVSPSGQVSIAQQNYQESRYQDGHFYINWLDKHLELGNTDGSWVRLTRDGDRWHKYEAYTIAGDFEWGYFGFEDANNSAKSDFSSFNKYLISVKLKADGSRITTWKTSDDKIVRTLTEKNDGSSIDERTDGSNPTFKEEIKADGSVKINVADTKCVTEIKADGSTTIKVDTDKCVVELDKTGMINITANGGNMTLDAKTGKVILKNTAGSNLKTVLEDIVTQIITSTKAIVTIGSPAMHAVDPGSQTALSTTETALKTEIGLLLG